LGETIRKATKVFRLWGRNTKVLVATEAFWGIPMSWVFFYRPIVVSLKAVGGITIEIEWREPFIPQEFYLKTDP